MPVDKGIPFSVDTQPTKEVVVDSLTRDITVEACLFDLIDNSIDAARETIFARPEAEQSEGLPESYAGFEVTLAFSGDDFLIEDNCGGIPVDKLQKLVLRFGQRSNHAMGIGIFGLGLNRALFKLGKRSHIKSDTGIQRVEMILDTDEYLKSDDWTLPAHEFRSTGKIGTSIEITLPPEDISSKFADSDWIKAFREQVGRRYGRFIQKGLTIQINGETVLDGEVRIRTDSPFPEERKFFKRKGVTILIRSGQHSEHRFSAEPGYDKARNAQLTDQFGWTVLCNDRAVLVSDKSGKTGWDTKFHTEFYGFVGIVSFEADNPAVLPWDTTKFDIDMNSGVYLDVLREMRKFAEKWRTNSGIAKRTKNKGQELLPAPPPCDEPPKIEQNPSEAGNKPKGTPAAPKTRKQPTVKQDHNHFGTILPPDMDEFHCQDKQLALVHEAKGLSLTTHAYSGMALIRCLFETSVFKYFERRGKLGDLQQFAIDTRKKNGSKIDDEKRVVPNLDETIAFLEKNPDTWGAVKQVHLQRSLKRLGAHKKILNSALHNPWQPVNSLEAFAIRDEVLPMLRHLIET